MTRSPNNAVTAAVLFIAMLIGCATRTSGTSTRVQMLVEHQIMFEDLPAGLVVERWWFGVDPYDSAAPMGGAYIRNAGSTEWYCADYWGGWPLGYPNLGHYTVFWGPMSSKEECAALMYPEQVAGLASSGTDGPATSVAGWFALPQ